MKLVTKEISNRLAKYPLYSQDGKKKEAIAVAKFFICVGAWTWFIMEADLNQNLAYGIIVNGQGECEYGYISLEELQNLNVKGLTVERDLSFKPTKLSDIDNVYVKNFINDLYED